MSTDNGGGTIESYHLQYARTYVGDWIDLVGYPYNSLSTIYTLSNLQKGESYKFRFRVKNQIGWSDYSDESQSLAAEAPGILAPPSINTVSSTQVILDFNLNCDSGGSPITSYVLEKDSGSGFLPVGAPYTSGSTQTTFTMVLADLGEIYTYRWYAVNDYGDGPYSDEVSVAIAD